MKYVDVFVMASVVFPTYFLARLRRRPRRRCSRPRRAGAIPSLAYSSYIVEETLAYPYAALCFFLIAKALVGDATAAVGWTAPPSRRLIAPAVRGELVVIPVALVFALIFASGRASAPERGAQLVARRLDRRVALGFGAIFLVSAIATHHSSSGTASRRTTSTGRSSWATGPPGRSRSGSASSRSSPGSPRCSARPARRRTASCACSAASRSPA